MKEELTIYAPEEKVGLWRTLRDSLRGFITGHDLGKRFFIRDLKAQYRQSVLGLFWVIILPLAQTGIWVGLSNGGVLKLESPGIPYPVYVLTGMLLWRTLTECVTMPLQTFNINKSTMRKINFPKEAVVIASAYKVLFNLLVNFVVLVPVMLYFRMEFAWVQCIALLTLIPMMVFALSLGLILVPFGALLTDVQRAMGSFMQLFMYLTPVIYVRPQEGFLATFTDWNPLAIALLSVKDPLLGEMPRLDLPYSIFLGVTLLLAVFGMVFYRHSLSIIIERSGS